jgi:hypothetical protein
MKIYPNKLILNLKVNYIFANIKYYLKKAAVTLLVYGLLFFREFISLFSPDQVIAAAEARGVKDTYIHS